MNLEARSEDCTAPARDGHVRGYELRDPSPYATEKMTPEQKQRFRRKKKKQ